MDPVQMMVRDFGEPVVLPGGRIVAGRPSLASSQDELSGDSIIAGRTRTLDLATADAPDLTDGQTVTWSARQWGIRVQLMHGGALTRLFLGTPR